MASERRCCLRSTPQFSTLVLSSSGAASFAGRRVTPTGQRPGKKVVELSVGDAFVLGATSKTVATFLTYPLVRAKVLAKTTGARDAFGDLLGRQHRYLLLCER